MAHVYCRQADGLALCAAEGRMVQVPAGLVEVAVTTAPRDLTAWRWDGATGLRAATAQEQTDARAAKVDDDAQADLDNLKLVKALALVVADLHGLTPAQIRTQVVAKYRSL